MLYLDLFRALDEHQVRYLLVGGLAMNLHGVPRMTMDVDLVLSMDDDNLDRFISCAKAIGLTPLAPVPIAALKDSAQRQLWITQKNMIAFGLQNSTARVPVMVDILIAPRIDVQAAFAHAVTRDMDGILLSIASIADMIALKKGTGRAQDESDIEHLERIRGQ